MNYTFKELTEEIDLLELLKNESSSLASSAFIIFFCSTFIVVIGDGLGIFDGGNICVVRGVNLGNSFCNNGFVSNGLVIGVFKLGGGCSTLGLVINFDELNEGGGLNASKLGILNDGAPFGNKNGFNVCC